MLHYNKTTIIDRRQGMSKKFSKAKEKIKKLLSCLLGSADASPAAHPTANKPACGGAVFLNPTLTRLPHPSPPPPPLQSTTLPTLAHITSTPMAPQATNSTILDRPQRRTTFFSSPDHSQLPVSQSQVQHKQGGLIRRRLSSISLCLHPASYSSPSSSSFSSWSGTVRRSKSVSAAAEYAGSSLRRWWEWGRSWVRWNRPATFAGDVEMNEELAENATVDCRCKGVLRQLFYKVRSEVRKLIGPGHLPTTHKFRYDALSYAQNFDDGKLSED